jgi:hypothetical protein
MSDSRDPTPKNLPEWRSTASPLGNTQTSKQFPRRFKAPGREKPKGSWSNGRFLIPVAKELPKRASATTGPTPEISLKSLGPDIVRQSSSEYLFLDYMTTLRTSEEASEVLELSESE